VLRVEGVSKRYGPTVALDDVSFEVERGQIVGFLGPNGAGKTTAMRAIMRLVSVDAGTVTWEGRPVDDDTRHRFGYMPAERGMYQRMRVRDHLRYYASLSEGDPHALDRSVDLWLDRVGLTDRAEDPIQTLSSGNQQRVQFALALIDAPELLILDEPFSGLDPIAVETLGELLREEVERGTALLLSSHQLDLVADVCSAVVIVDRGRVVLRGDVGDLRAASTTRVLEVEFAEPTEWTPAVSSPVGRGPVDPNAVDGRRYRLDLPADANVEPLLADARDRGQVVAFSFQPPDLSETFLRAVGRDTFETASPDESPSGTRARDGDASPTRRKGR